MILLDLIFDFFKEYVSYNKIKLNKIALMLSIVVFSILVFLCWYYGV